MHDAVEVVHEDPAGLAHSLDTPWQRAFRLQLLVDRVVDRLGLALGVARADDERVRVADDLAHVEHADVDRLAVGGDRRDPVDEFRAGDLGRRAAHDAAPPGADAPYRLCAPMKFATLSGT